MKEILSSVNYSCIILLDKVFITKTEKENLIGNRFEALTSIFIWKIHDNKFHTQGV